MTCACCGGPAIGLAGATLATATYPTCAGCLEAGAEPWLVVCAAVALRPWLTEPAHLCRLRPSLLAAGKSLEDLLAAVAGCGDTIDEEEEIL